MSNNSTLSNKNNTLPSSSTASPGAAKKAAVITAKILFSLTLLIASLWAGLIFWVHLADYPILRGITLVLIAVLSLITLISSLTQSLYWQRWLAGFVSLAALLAIWFAWLPPKQDRPWMPEVSQVLQFTQSQSNPNLITFHNVRDFDWERAPGAEKLVQPTQPYYYKAVEKGGQDVVVNERWSERTVDLSKLSGVDIINSYWMGEQIGHTLLSFRFEDERPLSFSIEIRKEEDESFSAFGGFVKQFEMVVVASEERDIVYTRSNVRGEQVYMFPIQGLSQAQVQQLFRAYLEQANQLQQAPKWYNTLIRNCTTVIFDMARAIDATDFPWDYRILMSGYVPNYLYDQGLLPEQLDGKAHQWDMEQWYIHAHINPKVANFSFEDNQDPEAYPEKVRQGLPQPKLMP
ncbi:Lnb N-terminal periplasmic domain-containing protein [Psychrobacter piechaudii]|uniref:Lnb N-terminal periplasmic domain-containing protein n=1 Tax=Psychrobacter piechaudii TaxID=1945521 RepID=A0A1R4GTT2_9GAMM|nr:DUF4105 domain-containing protein [Psychrobacter piechaudii]SJM71589.1 hypothetical protein A1232T_01266 [Psychrobacter piechaudii]